MKSTDKVRFRGFSSYVSPASDTAAGGVAILIRDAPHSPVSLNTTLQAVAVRVTLHRPVTVCSVYIAPTSRLDPILLENLVRQLPSPFLLLGDFNAHSPLWGNNNSDVKGQIIENFLTNSELYLFNDLSPTYLHPASGTFTSIDLSISSPSLALDFSWQVLSDSHGSDHFPIVLSSSGRSPCSRPRQWKLGSADWEEFRRQCGRLLTPGVFVGGDDPVATFSDVLRYIATLCISQTSTVPRRPCRPWFNSDCREAIRQRKRAFRLFRRSPTPGNLLNLKRSRTFARRTIRTARRQSWREYVSRLTSRTPIRKTWEMVGRSRGSPFVLLFHILL